MKAKPHEPAVVRHVGASNPGKLANDLNGYNPPAPQPTLKLRLSKMASAGGERTSLICRG